MSWIYWIGGLGAIGYVLFLLFALALLIAPLMIWRRLSQILRVLEKYGARDFPDPLDVEARRRVAEMRAEKPEDVGTCPRCGTDFALLASNNRCPVCRAECEVEDKKS